MKNEIPYQFIAIEGNIGAGKTTLANRLAPLHNARLILEQFADNPFLPKFYQDQSKYAFPLELSFLAERFHQLKNELGRRDMFQPNLVSDYFFMKSLVFARATLAEDEYSLYTRLFHIINDSLPKPDLFVFLYHDIERLRQNIRKRGRSYEANISEEYLTKVQTSYFDYMRQMPDQRILIIDVNSCDFSENEENFERIIRLLGKPWNTGISRVTA